MAAIQQTVVTTAAFASDVFNKSHWSVVLGLRWCAFHELSILCQWPARTLPLAAFILDDVVVEISSDQHSRGVVARQSNSREDLIWQLNVVPKTVIPFRTGRHNSLSSSWCICEVHDGAIPYSVMDSLKPRVLWWMRSTRQAPSTGRLLNSFGIIMYYSWRRCRQQHQDHDEGASHCQAPKRKWLAAGE